MLDPWVAGVRDIKQAAALWLSEHDRAGLTEADDAKLLAHVVSQTGIDETRVFDVLVDHWAEVRADASSAQHKAAGGGAGAQLKAAGHESPPIAGVTIHPIEDTSWIDERILMRTSATDRKGRVYGTNRNPNVPPIEVFNPRFWEVRAGDLERLIVERKHGRFQEQRDALSPVADEVLLRVNREDPISARWVGGGLSLTGGHHRTWEIMDRVAEGKMDPGTPVRILVHE
jgi:hypothetical protein